MDEQTYIILSGLLDYCSQMLGYPTYRYSCYTLQMYLEYIMDEAHTVGRIVD